MLREARAVNQFAFPLQYLPKPGDLRFKFFVCGALVARSLLVAPMRGDAVLGRGMHVARANLHFQRLVFRPDDRRVQRLVVVGFRLRDVIVKLTLNRLPEIVRQTEHGIAISRVIDQHTNGADVV